MHVDIGVGSLEPNARIKKKYILLIDQTILIRIKPIYYQIDTQIHLFHLEQGPKCKHIDYNIYLYMYIDRHISLSIKVINPFIHNVIISMCVNMTSHFNAMFIYYIYFSISQLQIRLAMLNYVVYYVLLIKCLQYTVIMRWL